MPTKKFLTRHSAMRHDEMSITDDGLESEKVEQLRG